MSPLPKTAADQILSKGTLPAVLSDNSSNAVQTSRPRRFWFVCLLALGAALVSAGCATGAKPKAMVPASFTLQHHHTHAVSVHVRGGEDTNPLWTSQISDEAFAQALSEAISQSGVFQSVLESDKVDYRLDVIIINLEQQMAGFNLTVELTAHWQLTRLKDNRIVFQEVVSKNYTATVGDSLAAVKRLRLANEGAARLNIQEGIQRLSQLDLRAE